MTFALRISVSNPAIPSKVHSLVRVKISSQIILWVDRDSKRAPDAADIISSNFTLIDKLLNIDFDTYFIH